MLIYSIVFSSPCITSCHKHWLSLLAHFRHNRMAVGSVLTSRCQTGAWQTTNTQRETCFITRVALLTNSRLFVDNTKNSTIHYVPVQAPLTAMYTLTSTPVNGVITASATDHKMDASVDRLSIYISTSENYYIVNSYCVLYNTYLCRDWRIRSSTIKFFV